MENSMKDVIFLLLKGKTKEAKLLLESIMVYQLVRAIHDKRNK
jgi:hypothetical protein